jgi:flagellar biosynthesis/type III secretory pathway M-ring protein FliF/YscJ
MSFWLMLTIQVVVTGLVVLAVLAGFWFGLVRPYLDRRVKEILEAAEEVEPKVTRGVKKGVSDAIVGFPELGARESTRQFLKFGSGLFENGLSSFLGSAADLNRRENRGSQGSGPADPS